MRFKSRIKAVSVFEKVCASLSSLNPIAWCRLTEEDVQFTVIPDKGSQCWSKLQIDTIFDKYLCQSATEKNTINLELPLQALSRALKSASNATDVWIKLTKKDNVPMLSLTIHSSTYVANNSVVTAERITDEFGEFDLDIDLNDPAFGGGGYDQHRERQTVITQDIPVKVLHPGDVGGLHEPRLREPDVNIYMPNLAQLKSISERFTKLAMSTAISSSTKNAPRLEMSANMHGVLKLAIRTDALNISSHWTNLLNPELDATQFEGGSQAVRDHPSTRMKELGGPDGQDEAGWAKVRIDAKDWSRVLSVGRVSSRVVGCLLDDTALVMYCWIGGPDDDEESCLTYYISSFSA
ncbi:Checkpoint protein hus1 [Knufia obscura]|uniref:Checkpoint protein n=2 Tax=Knufia TaxID=430999 RepID=A0AAN8EC89_9EURO|nr:Checkpoint protein hus1 [Knufia obscura]KAK5947888.1 Checkpoint protein hus1 [Knufia fluminis]